MIRYQGQALPDRPRIAVVSNDAIGNYVVVTPLIRMLRDTHNPSVLDYYGGTRTEELWRHDPAIDHGFGLHGSDPRYAASLALDHAPYDLIVNVEWGAWARTFSALLAGPESLVCGPCMGPEGRADLPHAADARGALWSDQEWIAPDLVARYPFLHSGFIGEIFARLAYLDEPLAPYAVPQAPPERAIPDVLVALSASLPEKLWPLENWRDALNALRHDGLTIGLLGAKPSAQSRYWQGATTEQTLVDEGVVEDLRGVFTMPQVVGALAAARAVLTLDNGILHLATAANTPTVGLFREGIHRLWAPPFPALTVLHPAPGETVASLTVDAAVHAVRQALG